MKAILRSALHKVLLLAILASGIVALWQVEKHYGTKTVQSVTQDYPEITSNPVQNTKSKENTEETEKNDSTKETDKTNATTIPDIAPFVKVNQDVIGYISIPDTNINYPVVCGQDNEYYLNHDLYGNKEKPGCIMADYKYYDTNIREEFLRHTLIFGHYLRVRTMFTSLAKYKDKQFFKEHPYIYFSNLYETGKWRVFSVYVVDADKETIERTIDDDQTYLAFLKRIQERSNYKTDVTLDVTSKVLTLCTCSYETDNSRLIVHAVLEDE